MSARIGIVVSRFNEDITSRLKTNALARFDELKISSESVNVVDVPGAVEIPIALQRLAQTKQYDALIAFGAVIRGETAHFDFVAKQASDGCAHVMMNENIPVIFGVLTTEDKAQALARSGGEHSDLGRDAVDAALEMVSLMDNISGSCCDVRDDDQCKGVQYGNSRKELV